MKTLEEYKQQLAAEGYKEIYEQNDGPGAHYALHTHETDTTHIILVGEMTFAQNGQSKVYRAGDKLDVAAGVVHEAKMGPQGVQVFNW